MRLLHRVHRSLSFLNPDIFQYRLISCSISSGDIGGVHSVCSFSLTMKALIQTASAIIYATGGANLATMCNFVPKIETGRYPINDPTEETKKPSTTPWGYRRKVIESGQIGRAH